MECPEDLRGSNFCQSYEFNGALACTGDRIRSDSWSVPVHFPHKLSHLTSINHQASTIKREYVNQGLVSTRKAGPVIFALSPELLVLGLRGDCRSTPYVCVMVLQERGCCGARNGTSYLWWLAWKTFPDPCPP